MHGCQVVVGFFFFPCQDLVFWAVVIIIIIILFVQPFCPANLIDLGLFFCEICLLECKRMQAIAAKLFYLPDAESL